MAAISVTIDSQEPRLQYDTIAGVYDGTQWDMYASGSVFVDFVTYTAMLIPHQFTPSWHTSGAGVYARHRKADYLLTTASKWVEHVGARNSGDYYLHSQNVNEVVYTAAAYPKNQPWWLSWFSFNAGNEDHVEMECGWVAPGNSVSLRFRSSGAVEVYKAGTAVPLVVGNIVDDRTPYPSPYGTEYARTSGKSRTLAGQRVDVALIPCRGRELLIISNAGGGFNYRFEDLDPNDESPAITDAGRFWWYVPEGQAQVQIAPLRFATGGTIYSPVTTLRYAPQTGATVTPTVNYGTAGYGSVSASGTIVGTALGVFTPDGTVDKLRFKVTMAGDGSASPWLYSSSFQFAGSVTNTSSSGTSLTSVTQAAHYSVPESPSDVRYTVALRGAEGLPGTVVNRLGNRAFKVTIGAVDIFTGRTENPRWMERGWPTEEARQTTLECRDYWKVLEHYLFNDPIPLDGMNLGTAFAYILRSAGFGTAYHDFDSIDFNLPKTAQASEGDYALWPKAGDSAAEWLTRLHEDYAANYYIGWRPTASGPKFMLKGTATLGTVPSATLYDTIAGGGTVYRSYRETTLEPEANDIWVMGQDPRTKLPILSHYADLSSQDPTIVPASRPSNWLGEVRRYGLIDPAIADQSTANWCVGVLRDRLTHERFIAEWGSDLLLKADGAPVWRGDVVRLINVGDFRVIAFSGEHVFEGASSQFREFSYSGEFIPGSGQ